MAYKAAKPAGTDKFKISPNDINGNFTAFKTAFDVDHVALTGTGGNEGKHKQVTMPRQSSAPAVAGTDIVLYNAYGTTLTTTPQLWFKNGSGANPVTEGRPSTYPAAGWFRHGSSVLVKWGKVTKAFAAGDYEFTFPTAVDTPVFATIPIVFATPISDTGTATSAIQATTTITKFDMYTNAPSIGGNVEVNFLAIGT